ncbi:MAG TPA: cellulose binding domain-containing protein [Polyangia bacterium]|nr:cellulose binding domain-containing protein [Polyangia bacterium]
MKMASPRPTVCARVVLGVLLVLAGCGGGAQMRKEDAGSTGGTPATGGTGGSPASKPDGSVSNQDAGGVDRPVDRPTVQLLANGAPCTSSAACQSEFCVDGVCCESACTGACLTCNESGAAGSCIPADRGSNPRGACTDMGTASCGTDGTCDGTGSCEKYPAGVACQSPGCTGGALTFAGRCDGNGTCTSTPNQSCAPFTCGSNGQCRTTCSSDPDCAMGSFCVSGSCGLKPIGASCGASADCNSGFCAQGVCCATACTGTCKSCAIAQSAGTCINVPAGQDPLTQCDDQGASTCLQNGLCDGKGACQNYASGTSCGSSTCTAGTVTPVGKCDGAGTCTPGTPQSCNAYACGDTGVCNSACSGDTDCATGYFCIGGSCAKKSTGATCSADSDCGTGHCAQGVCCKTACTGDCMSCALAGNNGTCSPIPADQDPFDQCDDQGSVRPCGTTGVCDGKGACAFYPAGTTCGSPSCTGSTLTQARTCDGAGTCRPATTAKCDPFTCASMACKATCSGDSDCVSPNVCNNGSCGKLPPGAACTAAASCVSGFCAQGVCCDTACTGTCLSCALSGTTGTCSPVGAGLAPTPTTQCTMTAKSGCLTDGFCDGAGHCRDWPSGTQCAPAACTGQVFTPAATCDGGGTCKTVTPGNCPGNLLCDSGGLVCKTTCTADADCVSPTKCTNGTCSLKPPGTPCGTGSECSSTICEQGVCCNTTCKGTCMSCAGTTPGMCKPVAAGGADPTAMCVDTGAPGCGTNGKCDGAGSCQLYVSGTTCMPSTCVDDVFTAAATCDGAGNCQDVTSTLCDPWGCGSNGACNTTCSTSADCHTPATCVSKSCGKLSVGQACQTPAACQSGFCANNVCCNNACTGTCTACNLTNSVGTCKQVPAGQAPTPSTQCTDSGASTCGTNGKCDGTGGCQKYASGTTCAASTCTGSTLTPSATCNTGGMCITPSTKTCNPYTCGATACKTTCSVPADCTSPDICAGGSCVPPITVSVLLAERDLSTRDGTIAPHIQVKNVGTNSFALSTITVRYWYTEEASDGMTLGTTEAQQVSCDYATLGCGNVTMSLVAMPAAVTGANYYLQLSFTGGAGSLAANGSTGEIQARIYKIDNKAYNETDDYSYNGTTTYTTTTKVTVYLNGTLIYGTEPM